MTPTARRRQARGPNLGPLYLGLLLLSCGTVGCNQRPAGGPPPAESTTAGVSRPAPDVTHDGIPPDVLRDLKAATVFLTVQVPQGLSTGSGFVVGASDATVWVLTNQHVVEPEGNVNSTGRPVTVVFHSGEERDERA